MKHLQLSPPLLIVTMGYPGSGKSFFARQFADTYGLARVSEDRVRFELFERPSFSNEESEIINRMMRYMLEETMQTEQSIICEGSFLKAKDRRELADLAKAKGYRILTVWLQTDVETSERRASVRDRRNPDSKYAFELDRTTFNRLKNDLQRPQDKEQSVVISGKHAFRSQNLTVLRKITSIYSENLHVPTSRPTSSTPRVIRPNRKFIQ